MHPILLLCLLHVGLLQAQQPLVFKHLTVESGLSTNSTLSIAQDHAGFLWTGTMDGLNRYDGKEVKIYRSFLYSHWHGTKRKINSLLVDKNNRLWIGTNDGLFLYKKENDSFQAFFSDKQNPNNTLSHNGIVKLYLDRSGSVWIITENGLHKANQHHDSISFVRMALATHNKQAEPKPLCMIETRKGVFLVGTNCGLLRLTIAAGQQPVAAASVLSGAEVASIAEDSRQQLWVGTRTSGLLQLDPQFSVLATYNEASKSNRLLNNVIRKLHIDEKDNLWIGTLKGLNMLRIPSGQMEAYVHNPADKRTLNFNSIYDIFQDRQNNIWIATYFGGLNYVEAMNIPFRVYQDGAGANGVSSNIISTIIEDKKGKLWIGTEAEGVNIFDPVRQVFTAIKNDANHPGVLSSNLVKAMLMVDNQVWLGLHEGGVNVIAENGKRITGFDMGSGPNAINSRHVTSLMQDPQGRIWIGHEAEGINIYDISTRSMKDFHALYPGKKLHSNAITALYKDREDNIWIGTWDGLSMLDKTGNLQRVTQQIVEGQQLSDYIYSIREDKANHIWVAAHSGLYSYNKATKKLNRCTLTNDIESYVPVGIVADAANNLWVSTNSGLKLIDATRSQAFTFTVQDGLPGNVFNQNSSFADSRGRLYFGSYNGLIEFDAKDIVLNRAAPTVEFTGLHVHGKELTVGDSTGILSANLSNISKLQLRYNQNVIDIDYTVMNLIKPAKNRSAYLLEGYDRNWIYTENNRASFTNLPAGKYRLLIKAANNDGIWNETPQVLQIEVLPAPWKTWWAYTLYAIIIGLLAFGIVYFFSSRTAMRRKLRYEHMMLVKQQELHQMKMDFFTHISHELRTPLTLIVGPVEILMQQLTGNQPAQKLLHTIRQNTNRLVKLTNDLLAFRKAESGHTQLALEEADIVAFSKSVFDKFEEEAKRHSIHFRFTSKLPMLQVHFDKHHLEIVLTNLLSNAFKFTEANGHIDLAIAEPGNEWLEITVCDDGIGIPKESQDKIFTGFYQAGAGKGKHAGSGIGLAFSKRLAELHGGTLSFRSGLTEATGKMETCFTIAIPLQQSGSV